MHRRHTAIEAGGGPGATRRWKVLCALALIAAAGLAVMLACVLCHEQPSDTASRIMSSDGMSMQEAQAMLDEQARASRVTISISPDMRLTDEGKLRVNFIVKEPNNGYSERLEVKQDGKVVYRSGIVEPGYQLEWGEAPDAVVGDAMAVVYPVVNGVDTGTPVNADVKIVADGE